MTLPIWEYLHARAGQDQPDRLGFFDPHDGVVYRDVTLVTMGQHGWELVSVLLVQERGAEPRYEYFFKRNRALGYPPGFANRGGN